MQANSEVLKEDVKNKRYGKDDFHAFYVPKKR